jgi:lipopolysaccharide transport system permease protein
MIKKIYFPRLCLPIATVLAAMVDFALAFLILLVMMLFYGVRPGAGILWLPLLALLVIITTLGTSLWLSALNVQFRDVRYAVPFLIQAWFFASPITYPSSLLDQPWRTLYGLNPMAGVVEGFRWSLLGGESAPTGLILVSLASALAILISGAYAFRRMEKSFADVV